MFRCSEVAERTSRLIDDELGFWPRVNMKLHIAVCRGCQAFVEQMRTTRTLTAMASGAADEPVPSDEIRDALERYRMRSARMS